MEPSYERPNTVSGLKAKHTELARLRDRYRSEVERLTRALVALETTIALFDPEADLSELRGSVTPSRAKSGQVKGFVLDTLRESLDPLTARQLAERYAESRGYEGTAPQIASLRQRMRAVVKACVLQGVLECVGMSEAEQPGGAAKLWAVAKDA